MILIFILLTLALLHFYWALGGKVGINQALPTDAEGKRLLNPSTFMTYMVSFILLYFTYIAYKLYIGNTSSFEIKVGWGLAVFFFLRTIGDFNIVGIFKKVKNTEFSKYDTWVYIPLCLFISVSFFLLLV